MSKRLDFSSEILSLRFNAWLVLKTSMSFYFIYEEDVKIIIWRKCKVGWCKNSFCSFEVHLSARLFNIFYCLPHSAVLTERSGRIAPLGRAASHQINQREGKRDSCRAFRGWQKSYKDTFYLLKVIQNWPGFVFQHLFNILLKCKLFIFSVICGCNDKLMELCIESHHRITESGKYKRSITVFRLGFKCVSL